MRKYLIAALVLAAGCDATRRDYSVCDIKYPVCNKGFTCNLTTELCEPDIADGGPPDTNVPPSETGTPVDVTPVEVAAPDTSDAPVIDVAPVDTRPVDVPITDVPITEAGGPDLRVPDAPGSCTLDTDCVGSGRPFCVSGMCVACKTSNQCNNDAGAPFCSAQNTCVSCVAATGDGGICSGTAAVCNPGSGRCVECVRNSDCPTAAKAFCVANQCQGCNVPGASAGGSVSDGGVSDGGVRDSGVRDGGGIDAGVLGPCVGAKPVCATSGTLLGQCVQCIDSGDCSAGTPICSSANTCTTCTTDSQCASLGAGPGICMFHQDGRCASEAETIYVKNPSTCSGGAGTAASPFCVTQAAVNAVTSSRRVIVAKGPAADVLTPISSTPTGNQISIIGQNSATINGAGAIGIHVTAGDIYVRGLTVAGGNKVGVQADGGTMLRLNRCIIKNNAGGGLIVNSGAEFDVVNSVFDSNGSGSDGQGRFFGGALLLATPAAGKKTRFWFNTVLNNEDKGVVCGNSSQVLEGLLILGNVNGDQGNCSFPVLANVPPQKPSTTSDTDANDTRPKPFDPTKPYHLVKGASPTTTSPCIDYIWDPTVQFPPDDIDGEARPYGAGADCGADEYHP